MILFISTGSVGFLQTVQRFAEQRVRVVLLLRLLLLRVLLLPPLLWRRQDRLGGVEHLLLLSDHHVGVVGEVLTAKRSIKILIVIT